MPRAVDNDPLGERLTVRTGAAAAKRHNDVRVLGHGEDAGKGLHVIGVARKNDASGPHLIDRIVGRKDRPTAAPRLDIAAEASLD